MPIPYEDFAKLDLRVGTVMSAEYVPDTDRLLRLLVDLNEEESRQIVSGIAEYFSPEDIVGKQIVIVANLESRTIRGVESHGMILAVRYGDDELTLLQPGEEVAAGSAVN
jgi:methionyl-tRNA synthetase